MENTYTPNDKELQIQKKVYESVKEMMDLRNLKKPEFCNRTLKDYIEDNQRRVNSYVEPKDSQGKEDWQANVALPTIRDKMKRIIAGFALTVPELDIDARTEAGEIDPNALNRADMAHKLIKGSYEDTQNPVIDHFWESWMCGLHGTLVEYEGYLKTKINQKFIKSLNIETGEVEFDEREVNVDDRCVSFIIPLTELFIPNFYINEIQEMPELAWVKYYDKELFDYEFGHYKNADKVQKSSGLKPDVDTSFYQSEWSHKERAGEHKIEVIRYYNRINDEYIIIANGVVLMEAPLLWSFNGKKCYPFAKTILEPFANYSFFYGKGMADILMGQYDLLNTYFNTVMDKGFRSLNPPTLIGTVNRDSFDLEDELMMNDTHIYVDDVSQVTPMPIEQISQADVQMINLLSQGIEDSSPSIAGQMKGKTATAREVVIAEEKIREMKSVYHEMIVELWRQKFQLRLSNIKTNYAIPRTVYKDGKAEKVHRTFVIKDTSLDKHADVRGTLAVQFRDWKNEEERMKISEENAIEEEEMKMRGVSYKKVTLRPDYLDNFLYKISVIPDSLHKASMAKLQVAIQEELQMVAQFFPEIFVANREEYFQALAEAYGRDSQGAINKLKEMQQQQQQQQQGAMESPDQDMAMGGGQTQGGATEQGTPLAGTTR